MAPESVLWLHSSLSCLVCMLPSSSETLGFRGQVYGSPCFSLLYVRHTLLDPEKEPELWGWAALTCTSTSTHLYSWLMLLTFWQFPQLQMEMDNRPPTKCWGWKNKLRQCTQHRASHGCSDRSLLLPLLLLPTSRTHQAMLSLSHLLVLWVCLTFRDSELA